jgi:hypothetical protein
MGNKFSLEDLLKEVNCTTKVAEEGEKKEDKGEVGAEEKKEESKESKAEDKKDKTTKEESEPVKEAMKLAQQIADMESAALQKEAELIGRAICDGFVARMNQYEKTASEGLSEEKIAHLYNTDPEFKASFDAGYLAKMAEEIEKDPEAKKAFIEGYEKTAAEIKTAQEKTAEDLIKVAEHFRDRGYADAGRVTASLIKKAQAAK